MDLSKFGTDEMPLRPSKLGDMAKCPMSVVLRYCDTDEGNPAAQTGSIVHDVIEAYHRGATQKEALARIKPLEQRFPLGDPDKARKWATAYFTDTENIGAKIEFLEQPVTCRLRATGEIPLEPCEPLPDDVVIRGTLDQVRRMPDGTLLVWDVKTGTSKTADEAVSEYQRQQAAYVVGAIQSLNRTIRPGGLIFVAGYDKPRARRHLPMRADLTHVVNLLRDVVVDTLNIRRGHRSYRPSEGACKYCPYKLYPSCCTRADGLLGVESCRTSLPTTT